MQIIAFVQTKPHQFVTGSGNEVPRRTIIPGVNRVAKNFRQHYVRKHLKIGINMTAGSIFPLYKAAYFDFLLNFKSPI
jgi:hypothetical protein